MFRYVCTPTNAKTAIRIAPGSSSHSVITRCKSPSSDANSSQPGCPVCSARAARQVCQITQPQKVLTVASESAVGSSPVALGPSCKFNHRPADHIRQSSRGLDHALQISVMGRHFEPFRAPRLQRQCSALRVRVYWRRAPVPEPSQQ
jgi:hypothetical protein